LRDTEAVDLKVVKLANKEYEITEMKTGKSFVEKIEEFEFEYNSLVDLKVDGEAQKVQFTSLNNDQIRMQLYYRGNKVECSIYDEQQY